jgi:formate-dependent nitrite reductase membrane component NrfD
VLLFSNLQSVMTWGVYFLMAFFVVSGFVMVIEFKKNYAIPRLLNIIGVIAAFCVALYTGVLLGVCKTFPLWNNALLPILFLVSALSAGAAALLLFGALFAPEEFKKIVALRKLQFLLPVIELVLLASLLFITFYNSSAGAASVTMLVAGSWSPWFWAGLVFCGLVLHIVVETRPLFFPGARVAKKEEGVLTRYADVGLNALALAGGFLLRLLIVMAAVPLAIAT